MLLNLHCSGITLQSIYIFALTDKMAGQQNVDQASDHHRDTEHPPGGQEWKGQEIPYNL